jgi:hypothetical protein
MHLEIITAFNKGDTVFSELYGAGVVTAIAVRVVLLPDDKDEEISYFVRFTEQERIVDQTKLQAVTDTQQSTLSGN